MQGFNTCLFCYGQTGTGKTTTIMGKARIIRALTVRGSGGSLSGGCEASLKACGVLQGRSSRARFVGWPRNRHALPSGGYSHDSAGSLPPLLNEFRSMTGRRSQSRNAAFSCDSRQRLHGPGRCLKGNMPAPSGLCRESTQKAYRRLHLRSEWNLCHPGLVDDVFEEAGMRECCKHRRT